MAPNRSDNNLEQQTLKGLKTTIDIDGNNLCFVFTDFRRSMIAEKTVGGKFKRSWVHLLLCSMKA